MKIARMSILASVIWIGFLAGGPAAAQQPNPTPELIPPGQPMSQAAVAESSEAAGDFILSQYVPGETSYWLDGPGSAPSGLGPCCEVCGEGNSCPPEWYVLQEASVLTRSKPRRIPLTFELFNVEQLQQQGSAILRVSLGLTAVMQATTGTLGFDVAPGYGATLGRYLGRDTENRDHFIEFSFSGLNSWEDSHSINGFRFTQNTKVSIPVTVGVEDDEGDLVPVTQTVTFPADIGSLIRPFSTLEFGIEPWTDPTGGFNRADRHSMFYTSDIDDFQFNARIRPRSRADRLVLHPNGRWRRECQPGWYNSYLFGFRVMTMHERFEWHSSGAIQNYMYVPAETAEGEEYPRQLGQFTPFGDPVPVSGDYLIRTHNDLVGLQIGGDWIYRKCKWTWGMRAKAGPFMNFSDMSSRLHINAQAAQLVPVVDDEGEPTGGWAVVGGDPWLPAGTENVDIPYLVRRSGAALLAEVGFVGSYKIRPNLTLNAAYDFMWITGLALAPEQLIFEREPLQTVNVNDNGHTYSHGLRLGFEWRF